MRRAAAIGLGLMSFLITLVLLFPQGCFEADRGPGNFDRRPGECPGSLTRSGFEWTDGATGLFVAPLLAILIGIAVGVLLWKRFVPPSTKRADRLKL